MARDDGAGPSGTLQELVRDFARHGDRDAIVAFRRRGEQRLSFAEINATVTRLTNGLAARGLGVGQRVVLFATNRPEWVLTALAILRSGATAVPIDAQMGENALRHVLSDSEARLVFATAVEAERIRPLLPEGVEIVLLADEA
ncbi:MAG: AMP-binding protein, partial [Rhodospirillales bacterium]